MVTSSGALTTSTPLKTSGSARLHRILGTLGMVGSPFLFVSFAVNGFDQGDSNRLGAALGMLFVIGWFSSVFGLWTLQAAGTRLGRVPLALELIGVPLAGIFQIYEFVTPGADSVLYLITDIAWPLSMLFLLLAGIAVLRGQVFEGWLRFTVVGAALWLPLGIVEMATLGLTAGQVIAGLHTMIGWFLIGYAVRRGGQLAARG